MDKTSVIIKYQVCSSESSGFTFGFEQSEDVALSNWAFHISDESSVLNTEEANLNLCNTSSGACIMSAGGSLTGFANDFFDGGVNDFG